MSRQITIRCAAERDCGLILQFVRELAIYEKKPEAVVATEDDLRRHGFGPQPRFETLIAELDREPAGFALFFPDFSTWAGRPDLFLEDLFVRDWARGRGVGRALFARLAAIAIERGWAGMRLNVLDWNPARGFYHRLGLAHRAEWLCYGADAAVLRRLADKDKS